MSETSSPEYIDLPLPPASPFDFNFAGLELCQDEFQGLQVYTADSDIKEVHETAEDKILDCSGNDGKEVFGAVLQPAKPSESKARRFCGLSRRIRLTLLAALLLGIVGLAIGLGVEFKLNHTTGVPQPPSRNSSIQSEIGGAIDPAYFSKRGAFNGSGIALQSDITTDWTSSNGSINLFYQHFTGDIRIMNYSLSSGIWKPAINGSSPIVVATDGKNSTPITAVTYALNNISYTHVFYLDTNSFVRQMTLTNVTREWRPGPISQMKVKALDASLVGMQACFYGTILPDAAYNSNGSDSNIQADDGMNLWIAIDKSTYAQYMYLDGESRWTERMLWHNFNGHAGVGCLSWGPGNTTYVMLENLYNSVEVWWKDTTPNKPSLESHPINVWQNATSAFIPNMYSSSSLGYTKYLFTQNQDFSFGGYNISFQAENSTLVGTSFATTNQTAQLPVGIPGSHVSVSVVPQNGRGEPIVVLFYQAKGDDITMASAVDAIPQGGHALNPLAWNFTNLPIPDV